MLDHTDVAILDVLQRDADITNAKLARQIGASPATTLRRVARLKADGVITHYAAILNADALKDTMGTGLSAIIEVSLDVQSEEHMLRFEQAACADANVLQCYRTSPGPDFVLIIYVNDMPAYLALAQRLFTAQANVRNVKAFFSVKRAKFCTALPLPTATATVTAAGASRS